MCGKTKGGGRGGGKRDRREIRRKLALHGGFEYRPTPTGWLHHRHRLHLLRPTSCLSTPRILHLQGGVTFKTLPVLDYPMPLSLSPPFLLSPSHSFFPSYPSLYPSYTSIILSALSTRLSSSPKVCNFWISRDDLSKSLCLHRTSEPFQKT